MYAGTRHDPAEIAAQQEAARSAQIAKQAAEAAEQARHYQRGQETRREWVVRREQLEQAVRTLEAQVRQETGRMDSGDDALALDAAIRVLGLEKLVARSKAALDLHIKNQPRIF
jgi:hypothetical protein